MKLNVKLAAAAAALVCAAGHVSAANHVDSLNREWLPLTTLTNFSWDSIDSVCQSAGEAPGACSGSLGGVDLTGWTWASRTEVVALIGEFMVAAGDYTSPTVMTGPHGYGVNGFSWASSVTSAMGITAAPLGSYTYGFTNDDYYYAWVCHGGACGWDSYAAAGERFGGASEYVGAWFYQATPVPEPETYAMLLAGLGLLGFAARRRKQKEAALA